MIYHKKESEHCQFSAMLCFLLLVLITALVKHVKKLDVYALRTFMLLAICAHHHFKEICLRLFVVGPDLTPAVADGSDLA